MILIEKKEIQRTIKLTQSEYDFVMSFGSERFNSNMSKMIYFVSREEENKRTTLLMLNEEIERSKKAVVATCAKLNEIRKECNHLLRVKTTL